MEPKKNSDITADKKILLISMKSKYWREIQKDLKHYEYRRKFIHGACEAFVYISGIGDRISKTIVARITFGKPIVGTYEEIKEIIKKDQPEKEPAIHGYLSGINTVFAIPIVHIKEIAPISLSLLRKTFISFHPPQSYSILNKNADVLKFLKTGTKYSHVQEELVRMRDVDQEMMREALKKGIGYEDQSMLRKHTERLKEIIDIYGCITISPFGEYGSHCAWLIVQHSNFDIPFQESYLKRMKEHQNDVLLRDIAYLTDQINILKHQKQLYATQMDTNTYTSQEYRLYPIEDEEHVDKRRREMGLESLEAYKKRWYKELHINTKK